MLTPIRRFAPPIEKTQGSSPPVTEGGQLGAGNTRTPSSFSPRRTLGNEPLKMLSIFRLLKVALSSCSDPPRLIVKRTF